MASSMQIDDSIRLNILSALLEKGSVKPNLRQLKHATDYHKGTLMSSLQFLEREGIITGYGPKVDLHKLGYNLEVATLLQANLSKKDAFQKYIECTQQDPHVYRLSGMLGAGHWNMITRSLHTDVESYQKHIQNEYYSKLPEIYDLIEDRQIIFATEPVYKSVSRTNSLIQILKKAKGYG
jgi:DNA-binding Lrp family transcriptional regulator